MTWQYQETSWYSLLSLFMRHLFFQIWDTEKVQPTWLYGHNSSAIQGPLFSQLWWLRTENKAQLSGRVRPSKRPQGMVSPRMTVATMGARGLGLPTLAHWHFIIKDTCLWNSISKRSLQDTSSDICVFWLSKITSWQVDKADTFASYKKFLFNSLASIDYTKSKQTQSHFQMMYWLLNSHKMEAWQLNSITNWAAGKWTPHNFGVPEMHTPGTSKTPWNHSLYHEHPRSSPERA